MVTNTINYAYLNGYILKSNRTPHSVTFSCIRFRYFRSFFLFVFCRVCPVDGRGWRGFVDVAIACRQIYLDWNWLCPGIDTLYLGYDEGIYSIGRESPVQEDDEFDSNGKTLKNKYHRTENVDKYKYVAHTQCHYSECESNICAQHFSVVIQIHWISLFFAYIHRNSLYDYDYC